MKTSYPDYPILGVGGIVFIDNKVVVVKRGKEPGYGKWTIPGGVVEPGETMEEAVKREILEETDLHVDVLETVKFLDPIIKDNNNCTAYHFVLVDFLCRYKDGKLRHNSDVLDAQAVPLSGLSDFDLLEGTLAVIKKASDLFEKKHKYIRQ